MLWTQYLELREVYASKEKKSNQKIIKKQRQYDKKYPLYKTFRNFIKNPLSTQIWK